ncbi:BT_2262 family domain-containing protein [Bacteroides sedimenti]|uniref:DUF5012 domain-containing protein n=1 Tax=Bacteroides sedimenti TaxID=2136147 RepID=A0ABN6Z773_9BACE
MKKILYSILACLLVLFTSCEKTTEDTSKITYFVTYMMNGDQTTLVPVGTTFTDPGVVAKEGEKDVTSKMTVSGSVNANKIGLYTITYSAVNVDGFASSTTRTVIVYDPNVTTDISGEYKLAATSYRLRAGAKVYYSDYKVNLTKLAPGIFTVSDFFGGYYDIRAKYGSRYAMTGLVNLTTDNRIMLLSSKVEGWGDSLDGLNNGTYNPDAKSIHWEADYAGSMTFFVDLNM